MARVKILHVLPLLFALAGNAVAQLDTVFGGIWKDILDAGFGQAGNPGEHGNHFRPAAGEADTLLTPALNALISSNISSFPLSSTSAGLTFDFSSGTAEVITESSGPILAETARTLGRGKLNLGFNYSYLSMARFRGLDIEDIRFTFPHQPVSDGEFGESPNENDTVDLTLNGDLNASIFAMYATFGLTNSIDIGVAIPFINISMRGIAEARVNSYTFASLDSANHYFGGDPRNPVLVKESPYDETASGIGDIAVRLKANFAKNQSVDVTGLLDIRLPTGSEEDFLGTGDANIRAMAIFSKKMSGFTPHLNLGFERRGATLDSDELEFAAGFEHQLVRGLTFAADLLGEVDVSGDEKIALYPDSQNQTVIANTPLGGQIIREIDRSNIPDADNDNAYNMAFGFKYSSSQSLLLIGNLLIPLNDAGLRSGIVPTVGLAFNF
jgi:hypothetical protein